MKTILSLLLALSFSTTTQAGLFSRRKKTPPPPPIDRCAPVETQNYVSMDCPYGDLQIRVRIKILGSRPASQCSPAEYTEAATAELSLVHPDRTDKIYKQWRLLSGKFEYSDDNDRFDSRSANLHLKNCVPPPAAGAVSFGN